VISGFGELYRVLTGKAKGDAKEVREVILGWADSFVVADLSWAAFQSALGGTLATYLTIDRTQQPHLSLACGNPVA